MESGLIISVFSVLLSRTPVLLVWVVTIVLAATRKDLPKRTSTLAIAGAATLLVADIFFSAVQMLVPLLASRSGTGAAPIGVTLAVVGVFSSLVHALGFGLLIGAIFAKRTE